MPPEQTDARDLDERAERQHLRSVFKRVMSVQVIALLLLWMLQHLFGNG